MMGHHQDTESSRLVADSVDSEPISPYVLRASSIGNGQMPEPIMLRFSGFDDSPMRASQGFDANLNELSTD